MQVNIATRFGPLARQLAERAVKGIRVFRDPTKLPEMELPADFVSKIHEFPGHAWASLRPANVVYLPEEVGPLSPLQQYTMQERFGLPIDHPALGDIIPGHEIGHLYAQDKPLSGMGKQLRQLLEMQTAAEQGLDKAGLQLGERQRWQKFIRHMYSPGETAADVSGMLFSHHVTDVDKGQRSLFPMEDLRKLALMRVLEQRDWAARKIPYQAKAGLTQHFDW